MFRKILSSKHFNLWDVTYQFDVKSFLFFCNNGKTLFFLNQFLRESFISLRVDLGIRRCLQINHRLFSSFKNSFTTHVLKNTLSFPDDHLFKICSFLLSAYKCVFV